MCRKCFPQLVMFTEGTQEKIVPLFFAVCMLEETLILRFMQISFIKLLELNI